jgi:DNA polymerase III subunit epsilon
MSGALDRMRTWWGGREAAPDASGDRWVVIDVETSGLDAHSDRLLAIAALGLLVDPVQRRIEIVPGDSFEVVLRQDAVSGHDNILLHGIGAQRQRDGVEPSRALQSFADFVGPSPLLAFHSAFDQTVIERYTGQWLGRRLDNPWLDVADLCAVTYQDVRARSLDEWMAHFGLHCIARHQASADTLVTAELLLRIWSRIAPQGTRWRDLERLASHRRWLPAH